MTNLTNRNRELNSLLKEIVKIAVQFTHADSCLIYVLDPTKQELILRASKNPHPDLLSKIKLKVGKGITGWVAQEKKPVAIASGANKDPRFYCFRSLPEDQFEAFLSVPILNRRGVVGVINIQHQKEYKHSALEINLLSAIGKLVGGAVDNALLIAETYELKEALQLRKLVEKAKGILMLRKKLTEPQAYQLLQQQSMKTRTSLKEIANAIVLADKIKLRA